MFKEDYMRKGIALHCFYCHFGKAYLFFAVVQVVDVVQREISVWSM